LPPSGRTTRIPRAALRQEFIYFTLLSLVGWVTAGELARLDPHLFNTKAAALLGVVKTLLPSSGASSRKASKSAQSTLLQIQALKVLAKSCTAGASLVIVGLRLNV
jgi:hypothetical protein